MASKKKRNRPRPPAASRGAAGSAPTKPAPGKPAANGPAANGPAATRSGPTKPAPGKPAGVKQAGAKGPTRAERLAAAEKARRRKAARTRALIALAMIAVITLITVTVISSRRSNDRIVSRLEAGGCTYDTETDSDRGAGRNHVTGDVRYDTDPPSGGDHDPAAAGPGIYTVETRPTDSKIVHALEHGYVTIWHRPDLAAASLDELKALAGRYDRDVLLVPRESLGQPVAATAWHRRLLCPQPDLQALERFVTEYRNKGPEKIPH